MLLVILFSFILVPTFGARILGIMPTPSYSHQVVFHPIWKELSLRGHKVTVITTDPIKNSSLTNLTEIDVHFLYQWTNTRNLFEISQLGLVGFIMEFAELGIYFMEEQLQHPEIQKLIKDKDEHFDLVMVEAIFPTMYAFAERFKCPFIALLSLDAPAHNHEVIGNPVHPVIYPDYMLPFSGKTFLEKFANIIMFLFSKYYIQPKTYYDHQLVVKKYFGNDYPLLEDIYKNVSLLFINTDPIFHSIRPLVPAVIPIGGGTHLKAPEPLPKDLQTLLDKASQGFIYFSLGSNVKSKELPESVRHIILETFSELRYLVLWKFELEDLPGKPDNVIISKWFPQQDVLRHSNIKAFITQGGLQSMDEAIYTHVPMLGMPFFGDQVLNVAKLVDQGLGLSVDCNTLDKETFKSAILEIISNPKYKNKMKELAQLAQDQPMTGLERAIWWTEYVLRHKGAAHLRSPAIDIPSYQYYLLDVIGFCLVVLITAIFLIIKTLKFIIKLIISFKPKAKAKIQ